MTGILKHKYKKHPLKCQDTRLTGTNKTAGVQISLIRRNKTQVRSSFASRVKSEKKLLSLLHSFKLGIKCHIKVFPTFAQRWQGYRANCFSSVIDIISGGSIVQLWLNLQLVSLKKLNWTINSMMLRFHANSGCSYDCKDRNNSNPLMSDDVWCSVRTEPLVSGRVCLSPARFPKKAKNLKQ